MNRFVVATKNAGKLKEIKEILKQMPFEVVSMNEVGIFDDIEETGRTFEENAIIKAKYVAELTNGYVMADDSGLEVDYLNGSPGVYSARFAGPKATDEDNVNKLLSLLEGVPFENRTARFVCCICVVTPQKEIFTVKAVCEGFITLHPSGDKGFGYDPVFYLKEYGKTMAELDLHEKNAISHRGKALRLMVDYLKKWL